MSVDIGAIRAAATQAYRNVGSVTFTYQTVLELCDLAERTLERQGIASTHWEDCWKAHDGCAAALYRKEQGADTQLSATVQTTQGPLLQRAGVVHRTAGEACDHADFAATVEVTRLLDSGTFVADIRVRCSQCGEPFRWLGCDAGLAFDRPMVSMDGTELRAPIEPEGPKRLSTKATFQMPMSKEATDGQ